MADSKNILKEDDDNQEEIVIVEDPNKLTNNAESDDDADDDKRLSGNSDEDDLDPDDPDDKEREAIRERRRKEKLERKARRDEAIKRDKIELDFLRKQNDELERRLVGVERRTQQQDINTLDSQIARALNEAKMADQVIAKAVAAGNGDDVAQALTYRDQARERAQQLAYAKQQAAAQAAQAAKPAPVDDLTLRHAQRFMAENKWYDVQGRDEDSAIVMAIDQALVREGFDPKSEDYWDELRDRAARRLPERFNGDAPGKSNDASTRKPRGGPGIASGREHAPPSTRREVYISPERKQALIEAGVWDDPVLRAKYVKRYAEYDRNSKA
jgi:hypothetical protein